MLLAGLVARKRMRYNSGQYMCKTDPYIGENPSER